MFSDLIAEMFSSFTTVMGGMAEGMKEAFNQLIYIDAGATDPTFSPLIMFLFVAGGVALAMGLLYSIFGIVRSVAHK